MKAIAVLEADDEVPEQTFKYVAYMLGTGICDKMRVSFGGTQINIPTSKLLLSEGRVAALRRHAVQFADLSRHRALLHE